LVSNCMMCLSRRHSGRIEDASPESRASYPDIEQNLT
jgi:hypothetical protein